MNATSTQTELQAIEDRMAELKTRIGRCPVNQYGRYLEYLRAYEDLDRQYWHLEKSS